MRPDDAATPSCSHHCNAFATSSYDHDAELLAAPAASRRHLSSSSSGNERGADLLCGAVRREDRQPETSRSSGRHCRDHRDPPRLEIGDHRRHLTVVVRRVAPAGPAACTRIVLVLVAFQQHRDLDLVGDPELLGVPTNLADKVSGALPANTRRAAARLIQRRLPFRRRATVARSPPAIPATTMSAPRWRWQPCSPDRNRAGSLISVRSHRRLPRTRDAAISLLTMIERARR